MNAILNVAVGGRYPEGQQRLAESLDKFAEPAEREFWTSWPWRTHQEVPYAFKVDAFVLARDQGYDSAIWFDAACWLVKPLDQAWEQLERDGYLLGQEGWTVGQWCAPEVRDLLKRSQEELDAMTLVEGKMIGLDLTSSKGNQFLDTWYDYAAIGGFNGSWDSHRHDITCAGIIASDMQLSLTPHLIEIGNIDPPHPEVYVQASGM